MNKTSCLCFLLKVSRSYRRRQVIQKVQKVMGVIMDMYTGFNQGERKEGAFTVQGKTSVCLYFPHVPV